jgi:hypothetical protein
VAALRVGDLAPEVMYAEHVGSVAHRSNVDI